MFISSQSIPYIKSKNFLLQNFCWCRSGSTLPGLRMFDPLLSPPPTPAEIFPRTCLQSGLQISPLTPQKLYSKFRNPKTTFENTPLSTHNLHNARGMGVPEFLYYWNLNIFVSYESVQNDRNTPK